MLLVCCDVAFLIVRSPGSMVEWTTAGLPYLHGCVGSLPEIDPMPANWRLYGFPLVPARAAHRSGVALIAIADSVTAAMAEDADHGGALRPHLTARAASVRKSRRCGDRLPSSKRAVSIL